MIAGIGYQAPIVMVLAFVPMLLIALAYKYLNQADPDCGTTFTWATRAFGPITGWLGGWGILYADVLVMASLSQIAGSYTFLLFGADERCEQQALGRRRRRDLDPADEPDLLRRHRGLGAHAVVPARRGDRHPRDLLGRRARRRSGRATRPARRRPVVELAEPVRHRRLRRAHRRPAARDLHLLGLGHRRLGERGDRGRDEDARHAPPSSRPSCCSGSTSSSRSPRRPTTASAS